MSELRAVRRALISVSDKTGIVEFARELRELEVELLSTGGTYRLLHKIVNRTGVPVTLAATNQQGNAYTSLQTLMRNGSSVFTNESVLPKEL